MKVKRRDFIKGCAAATGMIAMTAGNAAASRPAADAASGPMSDLASALLAPPISVETKPATAVIAGMNEALLGQLPFDDTSDFADALQNSRAVLPPGGQFIAGPAGGPPVWDLPTYYKFLKEGDQAPDEHTVWKPAPATANPSLWRQAQVNLINGIFEIASFSGSHGEQKMYQVRGQDITNLTIVEGEEGILLIDPCQTNETAAAGLKLYRDTSPTGADRPVKAVIYTHSHNDHFGGVAGVINDEDLANGARIIAPQNFMDKAVSENVLAGTAMSRRSQYSYGIFLPRGAQGQIDAGLGKAMAVGSQSLIAPTEIISADGPGEPIDGIEIIYQMTPDAEAPAEMMFYFPQFRVLDAAEVACSLIHNVYTLRGAEMRDAQKWSTYLNQAIDDFADISDAVIVSHNWPTWGTANVRQYLENQRDMYKYLHDQTLNLANKGYTMLEIAEELSRKRKLPNDLDQEWYCHGYYGSISVDVKAVYNKYIGYYDCNPAHLEPLPPEEVAKRYVDMMGGADAVVARAKKIYDKATSIDDFRWVAELMSQVVFADPTNQKARFLNADALEQLGYQAESSIWRNQYLTGALELRNGNQSQNKSSISADMFKAMEIANYFDYLGVRLNGKNAEGERILLHWNITDETPNLYTLNLSNSALTYGVGAQVGTPDAVLTLQRATLDSINTSANPEQAWDAAIASGTVTLSGPHPEKVHRLLGYEPDPEKQLLDTFYTTFNIVEP